LKSFRLLIEQVEYRIIMPIQSVSQKLHLQLAQIIASTPPGERLPSEPFLSKQLGVSRATLRESMRTFESQGLLRRRQGSGTYVTRPSAVIDSGLEMLESIETLASRIGLPVTMGNWKLNQRLANEDECRALNIGKTCEVIEVSRVIEAEGRPVAFLIDILPTNILTADEISAGFTGSVLDLLLRRGTPLPASSRTEITAATASPELARALGIQRGDVLLHFDAYLYAANGQVIDYSFSYFLPGYFHFHVNRRVG
jgi:GntR family transcriptional regulator